MDANGTRYQLLLGENDWLACSADEARSGIPARPLSAVLHASPPGVSNLEWDREGHALTLHERLYRFPPPPHQKAPTPEARRGAACDRYGNWYWIDATGSEILVNSAGTKNTSHFWSATDGTCCAREPGFGDFRPIDPARPALELLPLSGLAITGDHYLVVGVLKPQGLLVFDLHAGGVPVQMFWPAAVDFQPFDMAAAPGGGVWILDRANRRYWALDRHLRVVASDSLSRSATDDVFQPRDANAVQRAPACALRQGIRASDAFPLIAHDPIAVESLPDETVLILDRGAGGAASVVRRYRAGHEVGATVLDLGADMIDPESGGDSTVVAHDFVFVPEHRGADGATVLDRLFVASAQGDQSFAFLIEQHGDRLVLTPRPDYLPMRLFGGRGVVRGCRGAYYDSADRWVPLAIQHRPRFAQDAYLYTPSATRQFAGSPPANARPPFDGREPGCVWHRLMLDACIPQETAVRIWSRAADDPDDLIRSDWQLEPAPYLRADGSELPFVAQRTAGGDGTWELLLQRARGRYLQLKLHLTGNGRRTPRLRALRVYCPRFSYLGRYLPAVYREDRASASFLERFLANPEGTFTALEDKIAAVQMLFDPASAPASDLDWLAAWFGIALDPQWNDRKRRLFLRHAMLFFQYRGTVRGLQIALHLVLDDCADETVFDEPVPGKMVSRQPFRIVERFRTRQTPGIVFGDPSAGLVPARPTTARWRPDQGSFALHSLFNRAINKALDAANPSHTVWTSGFPLIPSADQAPFWTTFSQATLGFVPSTADSNTGRWQDFLERRYHAVSVLNRAHRTAYAGFTQVSLPTNLPADGAALVDWYQFQSVVLAMHQTANRFTVLLPAPKTPDPDFAEHQRRLDLTRRVIDLEKPAHTVYDIRFYWAYFRVGQARLGDDSVIDRGSRAPELMPSMVLGRNYLAESYVTAGWPQDVPDRQIVGRDRVQRSQPQTEKMP